MNIERIRKRLRGGFEPFVILTSDGHEHPVPHPEFIIATPKVLAVADEHSDLATLEPLHIVAIKDLPAKKRRLGQALTLATPWGRAGVRDGRRGRRPPTAEGCCTC